MARNLLERLRRGGSQPVAPPLDPVKTRAIDAALGPLRAASFADLGGVWAVDGGYTFYALERFGAERAVLVDDDLNDAVRERAAGFPQLSLVEGNFGTPETVERVGRVDAVILFDVLLHQVAPDWDEVLALYAPRTRSFVVAGPHYTGGSETVRLLDLGREQYLRTVPPQENHREVFERMYEPHPRRGRMYRDVHDIWQWGIVEADLVAKLRELGFELTHREDAGAWRELDRFRNLGLVFAREAS